MKKVFILDVALMLVITGLALAGIKASRHDLSASGGQTVRSSNVNEICVFCHTPHGGNTAMLGAPLWNRTSATTTWNGSGLGYSSSTMNASSSTPAGASAISMACLSCHDGSIGDEVLINSSGSGAGTTPTYAASTFPTLANLNDTPGLQNDHPIGLNMTNINAGDTGIYSAPTNGNLRLFSDLVECATCHDVHNGTSYQPFLSMPNAASAMCLACHNK